MMSSTCQGSVALVAWQHGTYLWGDTRACWLIVAPRSGFSEFLLK